MLADQLLQLLEEYKSASVLIPVDPVTARHAMRLRRHLLPHLDLDEDNPTSYFPHVTLFYGLKDEDAQAVHQVVRTTKTDFVTVKCAPAFFHQEAYDVVYFPVESPGLVTLHYTLRRVTGREPTYPIYTPHCTIAYTRKDAWPQVNRCCHQFYSTPTTFLLIKAYFSLTNETQIPMLFGR